MEAIKQALDTGIIVLLALAIMGVMIFYLLGLAFVGNKHIKVGEVFKVTSDSASYTCFLSESDNELSLSCLKTK